MDAKRILIIDDDVELCEELTEMLKDEKYYVENTSDTIHGEKLINDYDYDVLIIDMKMPRLSGVDLLKKAKTKNPAAKVIIMSGKPFIEKFLEEEQVIHLTEGIIKKPFHYTILLEKLNNLFFPSV
jgi:DNA-binding NtrC family response regulator